jgi:hypothetical protein
MPEVFGVAAEPGSGAASLGAWAAIGFGVELIPERPDIGRRPPLVLTRFENHMGRALCE